jgi:hypothetical protein
MRHQLAPRLPAAIDNPISNRVQLPVLRGEYFRFSARTKFTVAIDQFLSVLTPPEFSPPVPTE